VVTCARVGNGRRVLGNVPDGYVLVWHRSGPGQQGSDIVAEAVPRQPPDQVLGGVAESGAGRLDRCARGDSGEEGVHPLVDVAPLVFDQAVGAETQHAARWQDEAGHLEEKSADAEGRPG
jgi:hypothetical protein